jgi:predicted Zn-dependent protease
LYELGNMSHSQNQDGDAEQYLKQAVALQPRNKWYWISLAEVYKKKNDLTQLTSVFSQLISLQPNDPDFYYDKASSLLFQNKLTEAETIYQEIETRFGA